SARGILYALPREGGLRWTIRCRWNPAAQLSRQYWPAIQPDCDLAVGTGKLQSFSSRQGPGAQEKVGGCGRLAGEASGAELFRCSRLEPHVRLGVSDPVESAVVFRAGSGTGNFPAGADGEGNRQAGISRSRQPRV